MQEMEAAFPIKFNNFGIGVNRNEATSGYIACRKEVFDKRDYCRSNAIALIVFANAESTDLDGREGWTTLRVGNSPCEFVCYSLTVTVFVVNCIIKNAEKSHGQIVCFKSICYREQLTGIVFGVFMKEIVQIGVAAIKWLQRNANGNPPVFQRLKQRKRVG